MNENREQQLEQEQEELCPMCNAKLEHRVGFYTDESGTDFSYDGIQCPNGCDLWGYYG